MISHFVQALARYSLLKPALELSEERLLIFVFFRPGRNAGRVNTKLLAALGLLAPSAAS